MKKKLIDFEEIKDTGWCSTCCPYGRDCNVNSLMCSNCIHNFGRVGETNTLKCTGFRIKGDNNEDSYWLNHNPY